MASCQKCGKGNLRNHTCPHCGPSFTRLLSDALRDDPDAPAETERGRLDYILKVTQQLQGVPSK